jgi:hypothetical protein
MIPVPEMNELNVSIPERHCVGGKDNVNNVGMFQKEEIFVRMI